MSDVREIEETIVLDSLDWALNCEARPPLNEPAHAADLLCACRFCGAGPLMCNEHWQVTLAESDIHYRIVVARGLSWGVECLKCHGRDLSIRHLIIPRPL